MFISVHFRKYGNEEVRQCTTRTLSHFSHWHNGVAWRVPISQSWSNSIFVDMHERTRMCADCRRFIENRFRDWCLCLCALIWVMAKSFSMCTFTQNGDNTHTHSDRTQTQRSLRLSTFSWLYRYSINSMLESLSALLVRCANGLWESDIWR